MDDVVRISKRLSYWLRHRPDAAGLALDDAGWADVGAVRAALAGAGLPARAEDLARVVAENDKARFELSPDGRRIRARQGHSVKVEAGWMPADPPETLFHGTAATALPSIMEQGLARGRRHHVHLSADVATARRVGGRRGRPVVLRVAAGTMARQGHAFFLSANGVWLTEHVPPQFLQPL